MDLHALHFHGFWNWPHICKNEMHINYLIIKDTEKLVTGEDYMPMKISYCIVY